jgi:very-short-patch-repair endonuclease
VSELIVASEAIPGGRVTRNDLRLRYVKLHRNVYVPRDVELTAVDRAEAAWLWSNREATLVGNSSAALLGTKWLSAGDPAELGRLRHPSPRGIVVRSGAIADDEIRPVGEMRCTTAARTAFDVGRRLPCDQAVVRIDALLNATRLPVEDVHAIAAKYPGARGIRGLRRVLALVDGGAESPQETRLRLVLVRAGLPQPQTQIPVIAGRAVRRVDMGWTAWRVGVEYDGAHHFTNADDYANDIDRLEFLARCGWLIVRVSARQLRQERSAVVRRVREALASRGYGR